MFRPLVRHCGCQEHWHRLDTWRDSQASQRVLGNTLEQWRSYLAGEIRLLWIVNVGVYSKRGVICWNDPDKASNVLPCLNVRLPRGASLSSNALALNCGIFPCAFFHDSFHELHNYVGSRVLDSLTNHLGLHGFDRLAVIVQYLSHYVWPH